MLRNGEKYLQSQARADRVLLSRSPLFSGVSDSDIESLLACMRPSTYEYEPGEIIAMGGQAMNVIGLILSGSALVTRENESGVRSVLASLAPGDVFGEMAALTSMGQWPATVVATGLTRATFFDARAFLHPCDAGCTGHMQLMRNMLLMLSQKALVLQKRLELLELKTLRGKIAAYLLDTARGSSGSVVTLPLSRDELADFLNVARPSLSREMAKMADDGLIRFRRSRVELLDVDSISREVV